MHKEKTQLTAQEIVEVIRLLKKSDSVELKLTVRDSDRHSAVAALNIDVLEAQIRQIVFFDTPDLTLQRRGVTLRARRTPTGGDVVVKLRPVVPNDVPIRLFRSSSFTIEVDAMPGSFVCSGTLRAKADNTEVNEAIRGMLPIRKLFSSEQRSLYKEHAPKALSMDALTPLGPINAARLKFRTAMSGNRSMVAELWFYPDGGRILELSTKCAPSVAFQVAAEARAFLTGLGISVTGAQQTKTRKALEYFSHIHSREKGRPAA